jgi:HSP20 family protein
MSLVRYEPYGLIHRFQNELNRLAWVDSSPADTSDKEAANVVVSQWRPAVDIKEDETQFSIFADIPGVDAREIEVSMEDGVLSIKGERSSKQYEKGNGFRRVERSGGSFYRRFSLPETADAEKIEAKCKDGVLEIVLPKLAKIQPKRIEVIS